MKPVEAMIRDWWARDVEDVNIQKQWDSWQLAHRESIPVAVAGLNVRSVYEIGCGVGANLRLLRAQCPEVYVGGSDLNPQYAEWASTQLNSPVVTREVPDEVDASWDVTLVCYVLSYCSPEVVTQQLKAIHSRYLILMEPWGNGVCYQPRKDACPKWNHDWNLLTEDAGWRMEWRWPIAQINDLTSLTIFQQHPG